MKYVGQGTGTKDVGCVQANLCVPRQELAFYFEVTVKDAGERGRICIGFSDARFPQGRLPGYVMRDLRHEWQMHLSGPLLSSNAGGRPTAWGITQTMATSIAVATMVHHTALCLVPTTWWGRASTCAHGRCFSRMCTREGGGGCGCAVVVLLCCMWQLNELLRTHTPVHASHHHVHSLIIMQEKRQALGHCLFQCTHHPPLPHGGAAQPQRMLCVEFWAITVSI